MLPEHRDQPRVVLTGSSGLIGSAVLDAMRRQYQLIGFDRDGQPQPPKEVECICVDVTDEASVRLGFERVAYAYGKQLAAFIHLAAYYSFTGEDSPLYEKVTVEGTRRLLDEMHRQGFTCERFIFASTMLVHASTEPGVKITEDSPLEGKWAYPRSKIETERVIREHPSGIPATILRVAGVYTDDGRAPMIAQQIARIHQRSLESHVYPGDTARGQSYVHLDDTVEAIRLAVEHRGDLDRFEPFLIGEPETCGYGQLQRAFGELIHGEEDWRTGRVPKALAKAGAWVQDKAAALPGVDEPFIKPFMVDMAEDHYEVDISKARQRLGWSPKRRLIDTAPAMVASLKRDPAGWYRSHGIDAPRHVGPTKPEEKTGSAF